MNLLDKPLLCRLMVELFTYGAVSANLWRELVSQLDTFSDQDLRHICLALGLALQQHQAPPLTRGALVTVGRN